MKKQKKQNDMVWVSVRMAPRDRRRVDRLAARDRVSRAEIVRQALAAAIAAASTGWSTWPARG